MNYCENCGCKVYNGACTNCHEELYILDQYAELGWGFPQGDSYFMQQVEKHKEEIKHSKL